MGKLRAANDHPGWFGDPARATRKPSRFRPDSSVPEVPVEIHSHRRLSRGAPRNRGRRQRHIPHRRRFPDACRQGAGSRRHDPALPGSTANAALFGKINPGNNGETAIGTAGFGGTPLLNMTVALKC